jgi:hypothetical protein
MHLDQMHFSIAAKIINKHGGKKGSLVRRGEEVKG